MAHNWRGVGRALRLHPDLLNRIEANTTDVETRLERVLSEWLKKAYDMIRFGQPSWGLLVAAVAHPAGGNDLALAEQIAGRHKCEELFCPYTCTFCIHGDVCACMLFDFTYSLPCMPSPFSALIALPAMAPLYLWRAIIGDVTILPLLFPCLSPAAAPNVGSPSTDPQPHPPTPPPSTAAAQSVSSHPPTPSGKSSLPLHVFRSRHMSLVGEGV